MLDIVKCRQCSVRVVLLPNGLCPSCGHAVAAAPPSETDNSAGPGSFNDTSLESALNAVLDSERAEPTGEVRASRWIVARMAAVVTLLTSYVVFEVVTQRPAGAHLAFLVAIVIFPLLAFLSLLVRWPRVQIANGQLHVFQGPHVLATPRTNVDLLFHDGRNLAIKFKSLDLLRLVKDRRRQSLPDSLAQSLTKRQIRVGTHLQLPGYSAQKTEQLRQLLLLPTVESGSVPDRVAAFRILLSQLTPYGWITPVIMGLNLLVLACMVLAGANLWKPTVDAMISWGALWEPLTLNGQPWRLLTAMFLHFGVLHLLFNMWALWSVGPLVERLVGNVGFAILYLGSGLVGNLASLWWHPMVVSAGASGAVFGVYGCLLTMFQLRRSDIPREALSDLRTSIVPFLLYNLVFGAVVPGIDQAAHLGGFAAGAFCGLVLSQPLSASSLRRRKLRNLLLGAMVGSAVVAAMAVLPRLVPQRTVPAEAAKIGLDYSSFFQKWREADDQLRQREITERQFASKVRQVLLPEIRAICAKTEALLKSPQVKTDVLTKYATYYAVLEEYLVLRAESIEEQSSAKEAMAQEKLEELGRTARMLPGRSRPE